MKSIKQMNPKTDQPILPKPVPQGGTLGVVAPAGPFDAKALKAARDVLTKMGFCVVLPKGLFQKTRYLAGPDAHRAALIHEMFADEAIDGILCARGGYGSMRLLPLLDFHLIRKHPKPFVGFSDVTALLNVLYFKGGLVTYHGPMMTTLAGAPLKTRKALYSLLVEPKDFEIRLSRASILRPGKAQGVLLGGNLTTLCHLAGTPFAPRYDGAVLLVEDKGEPPYRIDRMLTQMEMAGLFEGIAGLVLGSFADCGNRRILLDIIRNCFEKYDIPIMGGLPVGHQKQNRTVPMGWRAHLDTDRNALVLKRP